MSKTNSPGLGGQQSVGYITKLGIRLHHQVLTMNQISFNILLAILSEPLLVNDDGSIKTLQHEPGLGGSTTNSSPVC